LMRSVRPECAQRKHSLLRSVQTEVTVTMPNVQTIEAEEAAQELKPQEERIREQENVRNALKQSPAAGEPQKPVAQTKDKVWFGGYVLVLIGLGALYYLFTLNFFGFSDEAVGKFQKYTKAAALLVVVFALAKVSEVYLLGRIEDAVSRYNLKRIQRLVVLLILALIVVSAVFVNWYTAIVSVGVISVILGLALQTTFTSFIGWVYIMVRTPYRVGDRIKVGDAKGDVIDVSYLDTTLWEFGGDYLSTDHPTGRVIKFPNSKILSSAVYNYSSPLFPYVWNEIKFHVAYESDLEFISKTMKRTVEEEVGEDMMEQVRVYRELLAQTPVDQLEVREHPSVVFRVSDNTWLVAIVRYLVHPKASGRVKTRLIKKLLERLNEEPDLVMFPKGNSR
jgi:small-conductance mechanosensitive channel